MEELWDVRRVAEYLDVSERTVYEKARSSLLPAIRVGRRWRFRPSEIEAWLDMQSTGASVLREEPPPSSPVASVGSPSRSDLEQLLSGIGDPLERRMAFVGLLSRGLRDMGRAEPIVVGGHAMEFYTAGHYATVDIDLISPSDPLDEVLSGWGFEREGRHWFDADLDLLVEAPGSQLEPEPAQRVNTVEVRGERLSIIGIEDLLIDRLNACIHWRSEESCEWARTLYQAYRDRLDCDYLRRRAAQQDVEGALRAIEEEVS